MTPHIADPRHLVTCIKSLEMCDVAANSRVMQKVLHALKNKINELELDDIFFLSFLLKKAVEDPLAKAILIALPVVFETQLEVKLPQDDVDTLSNALEYAAKIKLPAPKLQFIANRLMQTDADTWTFRQTNNILFSFSEILNPDVSGLLPLMNMALERMAQLVDQCDQKKLYGVAKLIKQKFTSENPHWYNESLCEALATRMMESGKAPLHFVTTLAAAFTKTAYVNFEFLEFFSNQIAKPLPSNFRVNLLSYFAMANYKPENFETLMRDVLAHEEEMRKTPNEVFCM